MASFTPTPIVLEDSSEEEEAEMEPHSTTHPRLAPQTPTSNKDHISHDPSRQLEHSPHLLLPDPKHRRLEGQRSESVPMAPVPLKEEYCPDQDFHESRQAEASPASVHRTSHIASSNAPINGTAYCLEDPTIMEAPDQLPMAEEAYCLEDQDEGSDDLGSVQSVGSVEQCINQDHLPDAMEQQKAAATQNDSIETLLDQPFPSKLRVATPL
eukprot:NODE_5162_length_691_cov_16.625887_g4999_i0.p1 GENE.NODE_5162_length_691_cov_16.625887_g4999_i0~~NODE_5162_length_691_cov_16.625887_g4999_i0.p1  ORF type:complete len:223 (-),score=53.83 NODE_5162_length_691_cov_16.625887_g4999_i0:21-653(-)